MELTHKISVYVPSTNQVNKANKALARQWTDKALSSLSNMFGGATALPATGAWVSPQKGLVKESIVIVYAFTDDNGLKVNRQSVLNLASEICRAMSQEAVALEIDNVLSFVSSAQVAAA